MSRAKACGVEVMALTDHDTVAGLEEAYAAATELQMQLITGIELSALWRKQGIHIVGLGIDSQHPAMVALVDSQQSARAERNRQIADRLYSLGVTDALQQAEALAAGEQPGRPHFAQLLISQGDRESTRLNSSHVRISYAVFCLKKKIFGVVLLMGF